MKIESSRYKKYREEKRHHPIWKKIIRSKSYLHMNCTVTGATRWLLLAKTAFGHPHKSIRLIIPYPARTFAELSESFKTGYSS